MMAASVLVMTVSAMLLLRLKPVEAVIGAPVYEQPPTAAQALAKLAESLAAVAAESFFAVVATKPDDEAFALSPPLILADVAMAYLDSVAGGGNEAKYIRPRVKFSQYEPL
jgi:hypothetical protein